MRKVELYKKLCMCVDGLFPFAKCEQYKFSAIFSETLPRLQMRFLYEIFFKSWRHSRRTKHLMQFDLRLKKLEIHSIILTTCLFLNQVFVSVTLWICALKPAFCSLKKPVFFGIVHSIGHIKSVPFFGQNIKNCQHALTNF